MRKLFVIACIVGQLAVLAYMAGNREWIIRHGKTVFLRTAPVDPRDVFRGDYVTLNYAINSLSTTQFRPEDATREAPPALKKGQIIYVQLASTTGDLYRLQHWSDTRPDSGVFIKGRINNHRGMPSGDRYNARYGIEQYFVEQGTGLEIEQRLGNRDELQIPMEVEMAIADNGTAVLRDYRWSKMGIKLEIPPPAPADTNTQTPAVTPPLSPQVTITLKNVSAETLSIYNPGDNCGFSLVPAFAGRPFTGTQADRSCSNSSFTADQAIALQLDEEYVVLIDLSQAGWAIQTSGENGETVTGSIGKLDEFGMYRILYRPPLPDPGSAQGIPTGDSKLWLGELRSPSFNARGRID